MSLKWKSGQIRCLSWKFGKGNLKESASWQQNQRVRGCREPHASQDCEGAEKIESRGWEAAWEGRWEPCAGRKQTHGWFTPSSILVQFQALLCVFQTILFSDLISSHCEFCGVIWACLNQEGLTETIFLHFYVKYLQIWSITFLISKWMWKSDIPKERTRTHWARKSYFSSYMQKILSASVSLRKSALQEPQT